MPNLYRLMLEKMWSEFYPDCSKEQIETLIEGSVLMSDLLEQKSHEGKIVVDYSGNDSSPNTSLH